MVEHYQAGRLRAGDPQEPTNEVFCARPKRGIDGCRMMIKDVPLTGIFVNDQEAALESTRRPWSAGHTVRRS